MLFFANIVVDYNHTVLDKVCYTEINFDYTIEHDGKTLVGLMKENQNPLARTMKAEFQKQYKTGKFLKDENTDLKFMKAEGLSHRIQSKLVKMVDLSEEYKSLFLPIEFNVNKHISDKTMKIIKKVEGVKE